MTAALPCVCAHLKPRHAGETYACRDCECRRYEPNLQAAALDEDTAAILVKAGTMPTGSTSAEVRHAEQEMDVVRGSLTELAALYDSATAETARVEQERDELRAALDNLPCGDCWGLGVIPAEAFGCDADGAPERDEEAPCPEGCEIPAWLRAERNDAADDARRADLAEAELASATAELERLRYSGWIVARDGGRTCGSCGQEIRRGEAYTVNATTDELTHVHCREGATDA